MTIDEFREQAITYVLAFTTVYKKTAVDIPDRFPLEADNYTEWEINFTKWTSKMEHLK